jgi:hypothetical protein
MADTHNELIVASWNSMGHSENLIEYMSKLVKEVDILFIQEHWHYEYNIASMVNSMDNTQVYGTSGMNYNVLLGGRPYGGCAILYRKNLECKYTQ